MQKDHDYYRSDARMPGEYDPTKPPLRVRFVLWLVDVLRIRQLIGEESGDNVSPVLTSSNGQFHCTPDHAVECAYLLHLAEAVHDMSCMEISETIGRYIDGSIDIGQAQDELREALRDEFGC